MVLAVAATHFAVTADESRTTNDGVFSEGQAMRGGDVYTASCLACHGATLRGTPRGVALIGKRFDTNWAGKVLGDLYSLIAGKMPKDKPGSLQPVQYLEVMAFILDTQGYRAGDQELPLDEAVLGSIRIEKVEPTP